MIFNLKYLILPLSIMVCINNNCINAMEDNESGEYKNDVNEELKNRVRKALDYVKSMDNETFDQDVADDMVNNFSDFLKGSGTLNNDLLQEIEYIIENYGNEINNYYDVELDTNEDVKVNENPISNNVINYSDENENKINTTEKNENTQLSKDIKNQLGSDLMYYSEYDKNPSLSVLKNKMDSGTLTMEEEKYLLDFYKEKNKNKNKNKKVDNKYVSVSEYKFNGGENTIYEEEKDENEMLIEIIVKVKNYLENKALFLDNNSIEYKKIIEQINGFNKLLNENGLLINKITEQQQEDLFKLQNEMNEKEQSEKSNPTESEEITQEQSEKANPTESEEKLLQMINKSLSLLRSKMLLREYKPGSEEHENAKKRIEECNDLIDSKDIRNNITKTQYEYFKRLQDEVENKNI